MQNSKVFKNSKFIIDVFGKNQNVYKGSLFFEGPKCFYSGFSGPGVSIYRIRVLDRFAKTCIFFCPDGDAQTEQPLDEGLFNSGVTIGGKK